MLRKLAADWITPLSLYPVLMCARAFHSQLKAGCKRWTSACAHYRTSVHAMHTAHIVRLIMRPCRVTLLLCALLLPWALGTRTFLGLHVDSAGAVGELTSVLL